MNVPPELIKNFRKLLEAVFNTHPEVRRVALVAVKSKNNGRNIPVICIEPVKNKKRKIYLYEELQDLATGHKLTKEINNFLFVSRFPVDPRHNAKIFREKLSELAQNKLRL